MSIRIQKALIEHEDALQGFFLSHEGRKISLLEECLNNYPCYMVCDEEKMIGYVLTYRFAPDILELRSIYIHPDYRGKNIGSQLLQKLENDVVQRKYKAIILVNSLLYPTKKNPLAQSFYEKNGYSLSFQTSDTMCFYKLF